MDIDKLNQDYFMVLLDWKYLRDKTHTYLSLYVTNLSGRCLVAVFCYVNDAIGLLKWKLYGVEKLVRWVTY